MKFLFSLSILLMSIATDAQPIDTTEWNAYMKNTRLYWDSLGTDYYDGIVAGNGKLGVNAYREGAKAIRFDVGRSDVTDQRPHYPDSMFTQQLVSHPRLPIGKMVIRTEGKILAAGIELDIYNAIAKGYINTTIGRVELFSLCHQVKTSFTLKHPNWVAKKYFASGLQNRASAPALHLVVLTGSPIITRTILISK